MVNLHNLVLDGLTSPWTGDSVVTATMQGQSFEGSLDELRLYDYALNETQIEELYDDFIETQARTSSPTNIPSLEPTEMPVPEPTISPVLIMLSNDNTLIYVLDNDDDTDELVIDMIDYVDCPLDLLNHSNISENYWSEVACCWWYKWEIVDENGVNITNQDACNDLGVIKSYDVASLRHIQVYWKRIVFTY